MGNCDSVGHEENAVGQTCPEKSEMTNTHLGAAFRRISEWEIVTLVGLGASLALISYCRFLTRLPYTTSNKRP